MYLAGLRVGSGRPMCMMSFGNSCASCKCDSCGVISVRGWLGWQVFVLGTYGECGMSAVVWQMSCGGDM